MLQRLDEIVRTYTRHLFETSAPLIFSYLIYRENENDVLAAWYAILGVITAYLDDAENMFKMAMEVIQVVQKGDLPSYLRPQSNELDGLIGRSLESVLSGSLTNADLEVVKAVLAVHGTRSFQYLKRFLPLE